MSTRHAHGTRHGRTVLTRHQALAVKRLLRHGCSTRTVAARLGIARHHVANIRAGRAWRYTDPDPPAATSRPPPDETPQPAPDSPGDMFRNFR